MDSREKERGDAVDTADIQFRTATFGGFSKQDVQDYIDRSNREHQRQMEGLQKELNQAAGERDKYRDRVESAESRNVELSSKVQTLTAELEEAQKDRTEREAELERLRARVAELEGRLEKAEHAADAYERIKDRTAGIELEAHCRAQAVEAAALVQVDKARRELEQWVVRVQAGYDQLRTEVEATLSHASGELEKVQRTMVGVTAELDQRDGDLKALMRTYEEAVGPQMPDPLPLEEPVKKK